MTGSSINCAYVELLRGYDRDRDIAALAADALCKVIENTAVSLRYAETEQSRAPGMR